MSFDESPLSRHLSLVIRETSSSQSPKIEFGVLVLPLNLFVMAYNIIIGRLSNTSIVRGELTLMVSREVIPFKYAVIISSELFWHG